MSGRTIAISLALSAISSLALAHSPYLLPNQFDLSDRDHVSVQASFTEDFFTPDVVMKGENWHVIGPQGTSTALTPVYTRDVTILDVEMAQPGTYRISSGSRDGRVAKGTIENGEFKFIRGEAPAGAKVYDIKSITRAEVYVTRGAANDAALAPLNKGLEFQLLTHPGKWLVGGDTKLRVLFEGKPVAKGSLTLRRANTPESAEKTLTTDADGVVKLPFAEAGLYHAQLRHRFIVPGSEARAESHTYALTLDVGE